MIINCENTNLGQSDLAQAQNNQLNTQEQQIQVIAVASYLQIRKEEMDRQIPEGCPVPVDVLEQKENNHITNLNSTNMNRSAEFNYRSSVLLPIVLFIFIFFWIIPIQYLFRGSLIAAQIWIASYAMLILACLMFADIWNINLLILRIQLLFFFVSSILEVVAFAEGVSSPVLYYYYQNKEYNDIYNNNDICSGESCGQENHVEYGQNYCGGDNDPQTTYCDSLQIGILVYDILNLLFFTALNIFYAKKIITLYRVITKNMKGNHIVSEQKVNINQIQNGQIAPLN